MDLFGYISGYKYLNGIVEGLLTNYEHEWFNFRVMINKEADYLLHTRMPMWHEIPANQQWWDNSIYILKLDLPNCTVESVIMRAEPPPPLSTTPSKNSTPITEFKSLIYKSMIILKASHLTTYTIRK